MNNAPSFAFVHGGGQGGWVWDRVRRCLDAWGAHTIALDIPGCGTKRARDTLAITPDDIADELLGDLVRFGADRDIILVGHSQAGVILPRMAERTQRPVAALAYISCIAPEPGRSIEDTLGNSLRNEVADEIGWPLDPLEYGADAQRLRTLCNGMSPEQARNFIARLDRDHWPVIAGIWTDWRYDHLADTHSIYITCERDVMLLPRWQNLFARRLHSRQKHSIDSGHQPMITHSETLAKLLLAATA